MTDTQLPKPPKPPRRKKRTRRPYRSLDQIYEALNLKTGRDYAGPTVREGRFWGGRG